MKYPEIQKERLLAVMAHIEAHPETWEQSSWHCGTTHCFGGWAQVFSGKPASDNTVRTDARQWLGLTRYEADRLFSPYHSLEDLKRLVAEMSSGGYDRGGYDRDGYDRDGYDRGGYDRDGYDRGGYDRDGLNSENLTAADHASGAQE